MATSDDDSILNSVLVCGDLIIDNHIYKGKRKKASKPEKIGTEVVSVLGGAHLTYSLIKSLDNKKKADSLYNPQVAFNTIKKDHSENQAYAEWKISDGGKCSFRQALGYGNYQNEELDYPKFLRRGKMDPDILVIDDGGLGFRNNKVVAQLPNATWNILKTNDPLLTGSLWHNLTTDKKKGKLITVLSIHELRKYDIKVSKGISWEQTCLDLCHELVNHSLLKQLLNSKFLVISIGAAGAVVIKNGNDLKKAEFALVFDPEFMENEWEEKEEADGIGRMCAFTAGLTYDLMNTDIQDLEDVKISVLIKSVKNGISYLRKTLKIESKWPEFSMKISSEVEPFAGLKKQMIPEVESKQGKASDCPDDQKYVNPDFVFSSAFIPSPYWYDSEVKYLQENLWTIFLNNYDLKKSPAKDKTGNIYEEITLLAAKRTARLGVGQLKHVPYLQCGKLFTIDRNEIENLRNVRKLILQYKEKPATKPFCLAVFGPPGAGKSFAVKQIAHSIFNEDEKEFNKKASLLTFNLSQFRDDSELAGAFHLVRDEVLKGKLPFVFWDEFDTGKLRWLQYFLAPMQDGIFQEGKDVHPIGKCIFIFAGGTVYDMQSFEPKEPDTIKIHKFIPNEKDARHRLKLQQRRFDDFKAKKGKDFKSRLHAFINVLGPDRKKLYDFAKDDWINDDPDDLLYPVRRALFIRTNFGKDENEQLEMDPGLIMAFLEVSKYEHGSRSLSRILDHLKSGSREQISRSDLPSDEIMSLHVDFNKFMDIANNNREYHFPIEELAQNIHLTWLNIVKKYDEQSIFRREYLMLPEDMKYDNIKAAERLIKMLEDNGFKVARNENPGSPAINEFKEKCINDKKQLNILAESEHEGWKKERVRAGWTYGENRNDYFKKHPDMDPEVSYEDFEEKEKKKDYDSIKGIPEFFNESKYKIVKLIDK